MKIRDERLSRLFLGMFKCGRRLLAIPSACHGIASGTEELSGRVASPEVVYGRKCSVESVVDPEVQTHVNCFTRYVFWPGVKPKSWEAMAVMKPYVEINSRGPASGKNTCVQYQ